MIILATTISLFFTILTTQLLEKRHRAKDRRLSAMMVMNNIEKFSRNLEEIAGYMATADSTATWLLGKPVEELELLSEEVLNGLITQATYLLFLTYDKTAENIFSNNIETWKNMGNVQFIDQVGECFSTMNIVEERWNSWATHVEESIHYIKDHPDDYEGSTVPVKCIRSEKVRHTLTGIHYWRSWLYYMAATMRHYNRLNMKAINITEQEVMDYTNAREQEIEDTVDEPDFNDFYSDSILSDNLVTFKGFDEMLEEMKKDSLDTDDSSLRPRTQAKR